MYVFSIKHTEDSLPHDYKIPTDETPGLSFALRCIWLCAAGQLGGPDLVQPARPPLHADILWE